jgi:hypothetical protein
MIPAPFGLCVSASVAKCFRVLYNHPMFRRRRLFQPSRPARAAVEQELIQANALFERGQYTESAALFERLATLAALRGGPRAPRFYLQAGRAWLHAGQMERGMLLLGEGRRVALATGNFQILMAVLPRLRVELEGLGMRQAAQLVETWLPGLPPITPTVASQSTKPPRLPLKCPSCGGPILPDEVQWVSEDTAECAFCGSPLRGE